MTKWSQSIRALSWIDLAVCINAITVLSIRMVPFGLALLVLAWLVELKNKTISWSILKAPSFWISSIPFSLALLGMTYTQNTHKGWEDISRILPFFLYLFLISSRKLHVNTRNFTSYTFLLALGSFFLFSIFKSLWLFVQSGDLTVFFYTQFIYDTNTYSIFNLLAILLSFDFMLKSQERKNQRNWLWIALGFSLCLLLQQSRILILAHFLSIFIYLFFHWKNKLKWNLLLIGIVSILWMLLPPFQGRFESAISESNAVQVTLKSEESQQEHLITYDECNSSTSLRFNAIRASLEVIKTHPLLGVGTGDWRGEMVKVYKKKNQSCNLREETAPHNQYLRTLVKYGVFGFCFFIYLFYYWIRITYKKLEIGQLAILVTVLLAAGGYDLMDGGGTAPFVAFFLFLFFTPTKHISQS